MKKVKLNSKLSLKKETIAKLNDQQMNVIRGGDTMVSVCQTWCGCTSTCDLTIIPCTA